MPVLRLIVAALVAFVAICVTLFAGLVVVFTGLVGFVLQLFRSKTANPGAHPRTQANRTATPRGHDDAIDVVATKVGE